MNSVDYRLTAETYVIPDGTTFLLYAPLQGSICRVSESVAAFVRDLSAGPPFDLSDGEAAAARQLQGLGLLNGPPDLPLTVHEDTAFLPRCVSLYLTDACNLRCVYCYARGGDNPAPRTIPREAAKAGIDLVAAHGARHESRSFSVSFHGAGEPTLAWDRLTELTGYTRSVSERMGLRSSVTTCTNGVLPAERARWLARNTDAASVSLDGLGPAHDRQRPKRDGSGSFEEVCRTLEIFDDAALHYLVRATITRDNVSSMREMVGYFAERFSAAEFQFDPLLVTGRCLTTGCPAPSDEEYVREFLLACQEAQGRSMKLGFSILSPTTPRTYYCCAQENGFTITHDGYLAACFECSDPESPRAEQFMYGHYDSAAGGFTIDEAKLARLKKRHVHRIDACARCFCKYMCGGDCAMNNLRLNGDMYAPARCRTVQTIGRHRLGMVLGDAPGSGGALESGRFRLDQGNGDFSLESFGGRRDAGEFRIFAMKQFPIAESTYMAPPPPLQTARELVSRGNGDYRQGQYARALLRYDDAITACDGFAMAHNNRGLVLHRLGRCEEAAQAIGRAISLDGSAPAFHLNLGKVRVSLGRVRDALASFERALSLRPGWDAAVHNMLWVLLELEETGQALTLVRQHFKGGDISQGIQGLLGALSFPDGMETPGRQEPHGWLRDFNHSLVNGGLATMAQDAWQPMYAAIAAFSREQFGPARDLLQPVLAGGVESPLPYWLLAMAWQGDGEWEQANHALEEARERMAELVLADALAGRELILNGRAAPRNGKAHAVFPGRHTLRIRGNGAAPIGLVFTLAPRERKVIAQADLHQLSEGP